MVHASLWSQRATVTVTGATLAAALILMVAWYQVSGTTETDDQLPSIVVSLAALGVAVASQAFLVLTGLRRVSAAKQIAPPLKMTVVGGADGDADRSGSFVSVAGMILYNRATCPFVAGKPTEPSGVASHEAQGRRRCEVCQP